jgi:hypothetical protein
MSEGEARPWRKFARLWWTGPQTAIPLCPHGQMYQFAYDSTRGSCHHRSRRACELAAMRCSEQDLHDLKMCVEDMVVAVRGGNVEAFVQADLQFHRRIMDTSANVFVAEVFVPIGQLPEPIALAAAEHELLALAGQSTCRVIVLDDDPTGSQPVHNIPVLRGGGRPISSGGSPSRVGSSSYSPIRTACRPTRQGASLLR